MSTAKYRLLMRRLKAAGFPMAFVSRAILPDWWDEAAASNPRLVGDLQARVARFLKASSVSALTEAPLGVPTYSGARLRRASGLEIANLAPAIHAGTRVAEAAIRALRPSIPSLASLPANAMAWRKSIASDGAPTLNEVANDLWLRGVPVIPVMMLPPPSYQAMAMIARDRPAIILAQQHDEPARALFRIAHEVGHLVAGDCAPLAPLVEGSDEEAPDDQVELAADAFALTFLTRGVRIPPLPPDLDHRSLATRALTLEQDTAIDAGTIIFAWARRHSEYGKAVRAVKALYRHVGAHSTLRHLFEQYVDVRGASEYDRGLLACVLSNPANGRPAHRH